MEEKGFYKFDNNFLYYAPNFIYATNYELLSDMKDSYNLPIDGWYWFNSKIEANNFFNIEENNQEEPNL
ncbi:hypothetical protein M0Q97_13630 [Candidatus Dojkabacteria bacterium]|jgi:hypothetical protein|nr:hypothetical protein [Candidatus Dojkabacteria bacterium]